jgi:hypothetical protein
MTAVTTRIADPADERDGWLYQVRRPTHEGSYIIDVSYVAHRDEFAVGITMIDPATMLAERSSSLSSYHKDRAAAERTADRLDSIMQRAIEHTKGLA